MSNVTSTGTSTNTKKKIIISALAALAGLGILAYSLFGFFRIQDKKPKINMAGTVEALAQANRWQVLKAGEIAVVGQDPSGTKRTKFTMSDGIALTVQGDTRRAAALVKAQGDMPMLVPKDATTTVASTPVGQGRIDSALQPALAGVSEVRAIITLKVGYGKYFENSGKDVKTKDDEFAKTKNAVIARAHGMRARRDLKIIDGIAADIDGATLGKLAKDPDVVGVSLDRIVQPLLDVSTQEISAADVWPLIDQQGLPLTGTGKVVGVIDTGTDYSHADLGGCFGPTCKVIGGYDFVNDDADPMDDQGHGTHVAATVAGNGLLSGVAPDAKLLAFKVCGSYGCYGSDIIAAIQRSVDPNQDGNASDHADVATMSLGGSGSPDDEMSQAVDAATAAGVVVTVAAGNSGPYPATVNSPGLARTAITVAAACKSGDIGAHSYCTQAIASFSSRGPVIWNGEDFQKPDIAAPGVNVCAARWDGSFAGYTTCFDSQHIRLNGTSMATPHVAGVAALIRQAYPSYTPQQVKDLMKSSAHDLGLSPDAQGAGEIDARAANPYTLVTTTEPARWTATTNPSIATSVSQQTFSVHTTDATVSTVSVVSTLSVPGIAVTASKSSLQLGNGATDAFQATVSVDNNTVAPKNYTGAFLLNVGSTTKGVIFYTIAVKPTLTVSVANGIADYGLDNPALETWTSSSLPITITNLRTDIAQTVTESAGAWAAGVTQNGLLPSLTVNPGSTVILPTTLQVNNASLPNGVYSNKLSFRAQTVSASMDARFTKYYTLTIQDVNPGDLRDAVVWVNNRNNWTGTFTIDSVPKTVYLNSQGPYDVKIVYPSVLEGDPSVAKSSAVWFEGRMTANGAITLTSSRSLAVHRVQVQHVDPQGQHAYPDNSYYLMIDRYLPGSAYAMGLFAVPSYAQMFEEYVSDVSANFKHELWYSSPIQPAPEVMFYYGTYTGLTADAVMSNSPSDFNVVTVRSSDDGRGTGLIPIVRGDPQLVGAAVNYYPTRLQTPPLVQRVYSLFPAGSGVFSVENDLMRNGCPADGGPCPGYYRTSYFDPADGRRWFVSQNIQSMDGSRIIMNGLGPIFWGVKFQNTTGVMELQSSVQGHSTPIIRQDYSVQDHAAIPYTVSRNGVTVVSGSIPAFEPSTGFMGGYLVIESQNLGAGAYDFQSTIPYLMQGQNATAQVNEHFDTSQADPNPPAIIQLYAWTDNARSEVFDAKVANRLQVGLDPIGGQLASVTLGYSVDGTTYSNVPLTATDGLYTADIAAGALPAPLPGPIGSTFAQPVTFRLNAADTSGNTLRYDFQMLAAAGAEPVDTTRPTIAITQPTRMATLSGITTLAASATDNVGVQSVTFTVDGSIVGVDTTAPYSIAWDSRTVMDGGHAVDAIASDGRNTTVAAPVAVVVRQPDIIAPTAAVSAPINLSTVSGTITVASTATDNVAVARVELYIDNTLRTTMTAAPYNYLWNTSGLSGQHSLFVKAYDAVNNVGTSPAIQVTVNNNMDDTTPPTVTLTYPTPPTVLPIGQNVTLAASASDNAGVSKVEFYVNGALQCIDQTSAYECAWKVPKSRKKTYAIEARAYDAAGNVGYAAQQSAAQ